jgi:hypothetical protein
MTVATMKPAAIDAFSPKPAYVDPPESKTLDGFEFVYQYPEWSNWNRKGHPDLRLYYCADTEEIALFDIRDRPAKVLPGVSYRIEADLLSLLSTEKYWREDEEMKIERDFAEQARYAAAGK